MKSHLVEMPLQIPLLLLLLLLLLLMKTKETFLVVKYMDVVNDQPMHVLKCWTEALAVATITMQK